MREIVQTAKMALGKVTATVTAVVAKGKRTMNPFDSLIPYLEVDGYQIWVTEEVLSSGVVGIGAAFREEAATYDERYFADMAEGVRRALDTCRATFPQDIRVLDIGCGSGKATFSVLKLFPAARVYAVDLSPELITILMKRAKQLDVQAQITPVVGDASKLRLIPRSFNLIIGSSMVHHLMKPKEFLGRVLDSLGESGVAIFYEPFQAGHAFARQVLLQLIGLSSVHRLEERYVRFMESYVFTIETMCSDTERDSRYEALEDKWMFSKSVFEEVAQSSGFKVQIFATNGGIGDFIRELFYLGLGERPELPGWVNDVLRQADAVFNRTLREELLVNGCIVFSRNSK